MALRANLLGYTVSSKQVGATVVKLLILAHPAQRQRQKMMQMFTTSHHSPLSYVHADYLWLLFRYHLQLYTILKVSIPLAPNSINDRRRFHRTLSNPASNSYFDTIRQNTELSHGITEHIPLRHPRRVRCRIRDLPLPWLQNIAHQVASTPLHRSFNESASSQSSEEFESNEADIEESLAKQFFKIKLAEQRRLMGVMEHHSNESG
jgi:hypothetical protein